MLIGILSDTHGKVAATGAALEVLREAGAERYIHCGDVGGEAILDLMAGMTVDFVWGNTDWDRESLAKYAAGLGLSCHGELADLEIDGVRVAVTHGDDAKILKQIAGAKIYQFLFHGHTHVARDQVIEGLRWVNPGAVHRSPRPSVAVWETGSGKVKFLALAGD